MADEFNGAFSLLSDSGPLIMRLLNICILSFFLYIFSDQHSKKMAEGCESDILGRKRGRYLGYSEERIFKTSTAATMWVAIFVDSARLLDDESIIAACRILVKRQEALQMCIIENETATRFQPMKSLDKINYEAVELCHQDKWEDVLMKYKEMDWDLANGPLWRLVLGRIEGTNKAKESDRESGELNDTDIFPFKHVFYISIQHTIADGLSLTNCFLYKYLPILSAVMKGEDAENVIPYIPLTKPVEEYVFEPSQLKNPVPWYRKLYFDALRMKNRTCKEKPVTTLYKFEDDILPSIAEPDNEPLYMGKASSRELTAAVILSAKRHRLSVHAVFLFANSLAMYRTAKAAGVSLPKSFKTFWPMDLRRFADFQELQPLAFMASLGVSEHKMIVDCKMKEFWDNCTQLNRSLYFETRNGSIMKYLSMQKYQLDAAKTSDLETVRKELGRPLLGFSNLGKRFPSVYSEGLLRVTEAFGGINTSGDLPLALFVGTYEGRFMFSCVRSRHTSKQFMDKHMQELERIFTEYCQNE